MFAHPALRICVTVAKSHATFVVNDRFYNAVVHLACRILVTLAKRKMRVATVTQIQGVGCANALCFWGGIERDTCNRV